MTPFRTLSNRLCISREGITEIMGTEAVEKAVFRKTLQTILPGWYSWESVPQRWRAGIEAKYCDNQPADQWWETRTQAAKILDLLPPIDPSDVNGIISHQVQRDRVNVGDGEVWHENRGTLPESVKQELLEECRWLRLVNLLDDRTCLAYFNQSRKNTIIQVLELLAERNIKLPTNHRRLIYKAQAFEKEGISCLISGHWGNNRAAKIQDEQMSLLVTLYCDPRKPTQDQTWNWYNEIAATAGWKPISIRTVRRHLNRPEVAQLWTMNREGMAEWRKQFGYTFWTSRPSAPDLLWVHDGTKVNYYYRTANGQRAAKLNVVMVIDAHSYYILGWEFSAAAENSSTVRKAVRKAVRHAGDRLPYQYLYDNAGSNTAFFQTWPAMHTAAQPNRGQSKPIEQMFGKIQQYIMRRNAFFTGQNITARGQRSKLNEDAVPHVRDLLSLEEVMHEAEMDFEIWNNTPMQALNGKTPVQAYKSGIKPDTMKMNDDLDREIFWETHSNSTGQPYMKRFEATRLSMEVEGNKYHYEVCGKDGLPDSDFYRLHQGQDFIVKYDPEAPETGLALYLPDGMRYLTTAIERYRAPRAIFDHKPGDMQQISDRIQFQRTQQKSVKEKLADFGQYLDAEEQIKLGHTWVSKDILTAAETALAERNGITLEEEEKPAQTAETHTTKRPNIQQLLKKLDEHYD